MVVTEDTAWGLHHLAIEDEGDLYGQQAYGSLKDSRVAQRMAMLMSIAQKATNKWDSFLSFCGILADKWNHKLHDQSADSMKEMKWHYWVRQEDISWFVMGGQHLHSILGLVVGISIRDVDIQNTIRVKSPAAGTMKEAFFWKLNNSVMIAYPPLPLLCSMFNYFKFIC